MQFSTHFLRFSYSNVLCPDAVEENPNMKFNFVSFLTSELEQAFEFLEGVVPLFFFVTLFKAGDL